MTKCNAGFILDVINCTPTYFICSMFVYYFACMLVHDTQGGSTGVPGQVLFPSSKQPRAGGVSVSSCASNKMQKISLLCIQFDNVYIYS